MSGTGSLTFKGKEDAHTIFETPPARVENPKVTLGTGMAAGKWQKPNTFSQRSQKIIQLNCVKFGLGLAPADQRHCHIVGDI